LSKIHDHNSKSEYQSGLQVKMLLVDFAELLYVAWIVRCWVIRQRTRLVSANDCLGFADGQFQSGLNRPSWWSVIIVCRYIGRMQFHPLLWWNRVYI